MAVLETNLAWALAVVGLFAAAILAFLGIYVARHAPHRLDNAAFAALALLMAVQQVADAAGLLVFLTGIGTILLPIVNDINFWATLPLPILFVLFALVFPHRTRGIPKSNTPLLIATAAAIVTLWLLEFSALFNDVLFTQDGTIVRVPLGTLGFAYTLLAMFTGMGLLVAKNLNARSDIERTRSAIVTTAFGLMILAALPVLIVPWLELRWILGIRVLLSITTLAFGILMTYAILRFQAFDVELVLRKSVSYSATLVTLATVWVVLGELLEGFVGDFLQSTLALEISDTAGSIVSALVVFPLMAPVENGVSALIHRFIPQLQPVDAVDEIEQRKLDIYRAALEEAWVDGAIRGREASVLKTLRDSLGIPEERHQQLEAAVRKTYAKPHTAGPA